MSAASLTVRRISWLTVVRRLPTHTHTQYSCKVALSTFCHQMTLTAKWLHAIMLHVSTISYRSWECKNAFLFLLLLLNLYSLNRCHHLWNRHPGSLQHLAKYWLVYHRKENQVLTVAVGESLLLPYSNIASFSQLPRSCPADGEAPGGYARLEAEQPLLPAPRMLMLTHKHTNHQGKQRAKLHNVAIFYASV